jgi:hypothetical protein
MVFTTFVGDMRLFECFLVCFVLTPKGLNVRTADKPVLVCVTSAHTIFRFLETFCEHASCSKLRGKKTHFLDLRIKSYRCLKFQGEVWAGGHVLQPMRKS